MFSIAATLSCMFHVFLQGCQLKHLLTDIWKSEIKHNSKQHNFLAFLGTELYHHYLGTAHCTKTRSSNLNKECQRCTYCDNILLPTISPSLGAESVIGLLHKKRKEIKRDKHQSAPVLKLLFIFCIQNKNIQHFQNKYVFYGSNNTFRKHLQSKYGTE